MTFIDLIKTHQATRITCGWVSIHYDKMSMEWEVWIEPQYSEEQQRQIPTHCAISTKDEQEAVDEYFKHI